MPDNVGYTPGSGATVAADEIGGVLFQRVKPVTGVDGTAVDVSATNPMPMAAYGELIEAVEALRMAVTVLARNAPISDGANRVRVAVETLPTTVNVSTVSTVSSITTVANVAEFGARPIGAIPSAITNGSFQQLRSNITVT
jgi:hypothetical protein